METKTSIFYRVIPNPSFSELYAKTLKEARRIKQEFGECTSKDATAENKAFWAKQREACKIVKVTETIEVIE